MKPSAYGEINSTHKFQRVTFRLFTLFLKLEAH